MNISDAANIAGLPVKTVRYYEDIGLVVPGRQPNGYRAFSDQNLNKLTFVSRARSLGFSIGECRTLLALYEDRTRASSDVKAVVEEHLVQIDSKIAELASMKATLSDLVLRCHGDDRPDCPILAELGGP